MRMSEPGSADRHAILIVALTGRHMRMAPGPSTALSYNAIPLISYQLT